MRSCTCLSGSVGRSIGPSVNFARNHVDTGSLGQASREFSILLSVITTLFVIPSATAASHDAWSFLSGIGMADFDLESEAEKLYREANVYGLLSHFLWALWSFKQDTISKITFAYNE